MMRMLQCLMLSAAISGLFAGRLQAGEFNPFQIPKTEFLASVDTIALWPASFPSDTAQPEMLWQMIEEMLTTSLIEMGFKVIPSSRVRERWEEISSLVGGVYDPITGESDEERVVLLRGLIKQELALDNGADAFLSTWITEGHLKIWAKRLDHTEREPDGPATVWMAGHEPIEWNGSMMSSFFMDRPHEARGPRLGLKMSDPTDVSLYYAILSVRWTRLYLRGSYDDRPPSPLIEHKERLETVVELLTKPLSAEELVPEES